MPEDDLPGPIAWAVLITLLGIGVALFALAGV